MINKKLRDKLIKNSTLDATSVLSESILFRPSDEITTMVPAINVALSGRVDGGFSYGVLQIAGPSKHFKTAFALLVVTSFLSKYSDGIVLFYDSEFGTPESYFRSFSIDPERVVHSPIMDVEELRQDVIKQLEDITPEDKVLIMVDSIGGTPSRKELEDALEQKTVADMSRAKQLKSFFRMTGPRINIKKIPMVIINHSYKEIGLFPKDIVGGGTGSIYHSDDIWMVGRNQEKEDNQITGYRFIIKIEKSRTVKEGSKIPITVTFDKGIQRWSGLLDLALEAGLLQKVGAKRSLAYQVPGTETLFKEDDLEFNTEFWMTALEAKGEGSFSQFIENKYRLANGPIYSTEGV